MAFDQAIADQICERLAQGETYSSICKTPGFPSTTEAWRWRNENPSFAESIARAREVGHDVIADDCVVIADDNKLKPDDKRIRVDTRLRLLEKWDKRYSAKVDHTHDVTSRILLVDARSVAVDVAAQVLPAAVTALEHDPKAR